MPPKAPTQPAHRGKIIRYIYLYLVTAITIVMILISTIGFLNLILKEYVLKVKDYTAFDPAWECQDDTLFYSYDTVGSKVEKYPGIAPADKDAKKIQCEADTKARNELRHVNDIKRDLSMWIAMMIVALPLYLYHWGVIKKENKK